MTAIPATHHLPAPAPCGQRILRAARNVAYDGDDPIAYASRFLRREESNLKTLLALSRLIDGLNERIGHGIYWLILVAVLISAGNAVIRYTFNMSSNAWLEIQWYLFSAVFLFCAGYTLLHNQHIRIDVIAGRLSHRAQAWIDIFGTLFFLLPMAVTIMWLSWPVFVDAYQRNEVSTNAGGLIIWPARLMLPIGFLLLVLQGCSELIKRIAFLRGMIPNPAEKAEAPTAEELLAEEIRKARGEPV